MRHLLGIDIGSYSAKGVLLDETGKILATAQRAHKMRVPTPGLAEHDAETDWWQGFTTLSRLLLDETGIDPKSIAAVGCSGIGPCVLPVDAEGQPLRRAILFGVDTRAHLQIDALNQELGADAIFERCGNALSTQSVGPKLRWIAENEPDVFQKTHKVASCTSFLVHRLTGVWAVDHYSASAMTPLYDLRNCCWNTEWVEQICPREWLPDLYWSNETVGRVTPAAAEVTGLAEGTPVIAGTIDAASEALSVGVSRPGDLMIMYGTTVFFIQIAQNPAVDRRYWAAPWLFPESWAMMGGLSTGGSLTQWFRDEIARAASDDDFFANMAQAAQSRPGGANGLIVLPYFSGERTPINDPHARGVCFGLTLAHTQADLYRAILEGISHAVRHNLDVFAETAPANRAFAVGGGVHNACWIQAVSDIAKITQTVRTQTIGAAFGSAFLAGTGVDLFALDDIETFNPQLRQIEPNPDMADLYDKDHQRFLKLYQCTRDLL